MRQGTRQGEIGMGRCGIFLCVGGCVSGMCVWCGVYMCGFAVVCCACMCEKTRPPARVYYDISKIFTYSVEERMCECMAGGGGGG